jgi:hypothetical protein
MPATLTTPNPPADVDEPACDRCGNHTSPARYDCCGDDVCGDCEDDHNAACDVWGQWREEDYTADQGIGGWSE